MTPPLTPPRLPLTELLFVSSLWARNAALRFPTLANYNVITQSGGGGAVPIRSIVWGPVRLHGVITCLTPRNHQICDNEAPSLLLKTPGRGIQVGFT